MNPVIAITMMQTTPVGESPAAKRWSEVRTYYETRSTVIQRFKTYDQTTGKVRYQGSVRFKRNLTYEFVFDDLFEKCRAGEKWSRDTSASTFVSPPEMRGYNDTVSARQPYLLLRLLLADKRLPTNADTLTKQRVGRRAFEQIGFSDGWSVLIDPTTKALIHIVGNEQALGETVLKTVFY